MFKFLFGRASKEPEVIVQETQRETVARALRELNEVLTALSPRAGIHVDLQSGTLSVDLPDQMPDEAKALPAPDKANAPESDAKDQDKTQAGPQTP
ncbi:hypothetical protein [Roseinatronobacter sp.]